MVDLRFGGVGWTSRSLWRSEGEGEREHGDGYLNPVRGTRWRGEYVKTIAIAKNREVCAARDAILSPPRARAF